MTTVSIHMPENTGLTGFTLFLRKTSDGTLVNTNGDALTESPASSGRFTATVAEAWTETLAAVVLDSNSLAVRDGWLANGETIVRDGYPAGSASGGLTPDQAAQLNRIETQTSKLSGTSVEVTGNVKPGGQIVLKHGDNHTVALGNPIVVAVSDIGGSLYTLMNAVGAGNLQVAAIRGTDQASRILGTVSSLSYASDVLTVTMQFTAAETAKGIVGPVYVYDVVRTTDPTRTYFSGKLTVTRDAR